MKRNRRFPLTSVLVALLLAAAVIYLSYLDVDVPRRALSQVRSAAAQLGDSLLGIVRAEGGGLTFSVPQQPVEEPAQGGILFTTEEATSAPVQAAAMPLLVNEANPVPEGYAPTGLVRMRDYCDSSVVYIKGSDIEGEREAVDALMQMLRAAIAQGVGNWQISAGYRSVTYQQTLWDNQVYEYRQQGLSGAKAREATAKYVAVPGASEHHTGLAFDVTVPGESFPLTEQSRWLTENCWDYGFIIRYTEEKQPITGINAEPWHIRYVGQPHAVMMRDGNLCLEEYLGQN